MLARDEDALLCDMAEVYHIYDLRALPVRTLAVLACGLPESSRSKMSASGSRLTPEQTLLCGVFDQLTALRWMLSGDKRKGKKPPSILDKLGGEGKNQKKTITGYASAAEFEAARQAILQGKEG